MIDLYEILGVERDASLETIKTAYRTMSHRLHPDKPGGDSESFNQLSLAYKILSNKADRERYDLTGEVPEKEPDLTGPLGEIFNTVLSEHFKLWNETGSGIPNLIDKALAIVADRIEETERAIHDLIEQMRKLELLKGRIGSAVDSTGGECFDAAVERGITTNRLSLRKAWKSRRRMQRLQNYLEKSYDLRPGVYIPTPSGRKNAVWGPYL